MKRLTKKSCAILMSAILLFSSLASGIVLTASAWDDVETLPSDLFFDLTTKTSYDALVAEKALGVYGKEGGFTYGFENGALKIRYTSTNSNATQLQLGSNRTRTASATEYPILAMKVKITAPYTTTHTTWTKGPVLHSVNVGDNTYTVPDDAVSENTYDLTTTNWQLMTVDMSGARGDAANWNWIQLYLDKVGGYTTNTGTIISIQWAGMFKSTADAQTYYDSTDDVVSALPSDLFADYTTQESFNAITAEDTYSFHNKSTAAFDATENAAKITYYVANPELRVGWGTQKRQVFSKDYPIFAMKVKINETTTETTGNKRTGPHFRYVNLGTGTNYNTYNNATVEYDHNNTSDYQLLICDVTSSDNVTYSQMQVILDEYGGFNNTTKTMWIKWAGMFASVEEATRYYNAETPAATPITNKASRQTNADGNALRFGFDIATEDYSGISYDAGSYEAARTTGNYARKMDSAKMNLGGTETAIVGFGALITKSDLADAAFVVGADGVKKVEADNLYGLDADELTYTVRITNIPEANKGTTIYARSYVAYMDGDNRVYVYGDIVSDSVNGAITE